MSHDDCVTNTELGNVCDSVDTGLVQGLASGVGTHKLNPVVVTENSETARTSKSVAASMMGEQPTQGLGTAECMEQGLATSGVGTQELIPRVGLEITKATGIIKSVAISMTSHDENGVGTGNLLDKVLATCETEGMIESGELSGVDDKLGYNVMPD